MFSRKAFSMIELVFVIVVMGILGKFGTEFLAQAYRSFIFANVNHTLQSNSAKALEFISSRLAYRIKDSVIVRTAIGATPVSIGSVTTSGNTVLEWVSSDVDGFRGYTKPYWSGIIDLNASTATLLSSPDTNTSEIDALIDKLSHGGSNINSAALYFIGSNSDINAYGWDGNPITSQVGAAMHPIKADPTNIANFIPRDGSSTTTPNTFAGVDVYEYYKLSWTANAVVYTAGTNSKGTLTFYYDYQPWNGETINNAKNSIIMQNVSTFQFIAIGSILKIQVCTKSDLIAEETYSICKEKTIF